MADEKQMEAAGIDLDMLRRIYPQQMRLCDEDVEVNQDVFQESWQEAYRDEHGYVTWDGDEVRAEHDAVGLASRFQRNIESRLADLGID